METFQTGRHKNVPHFFFSRGFTKKKKDVGSEELPTYKGLAKQNNEVLTSNTEYLTRRGKNVLGRRLTEL